MKAKKIVISIIIIILIILGLYFINSKFKILDSIFGLGTTEYKEKEEEPKLQIVDEESNSRIIAVMINNNHAAWPHAGLQDAFLNYEIIVEGGITRILSLFKDADTEKIGSVRSARHYFLDYAMENDAIYVHHGRSPQALEDIESYNIDDIEGLYDEDGFWRDKTLNKAYEHTSFTNIEKINTVIKEKGYRTTTDTDLLLNYSAKEIDLSKKENSIKADKVSIEYSSYQTTYYEYDPETKLYLRSMDDEPHVDAITKEQYTTKNIITYQVKNRTIDSDGRQDLDNVGSGEGYYISNGYAVPITWEKASRSSQTVYKYMDGTEIDVNDGVTWIQIQPVGKELGIEALEEEYNDTEE